MNKHFTYQGDSSEKLLRFGYENNKGNTYSIQQQIKYIYSPLCLEKVIKNQNIECDNCDYHIYDIEEIADIDVVVPYIIKENSRSIICNQYIIEILKLSYSLKILSKQVYKDKKNFHKIHGHIDIKHAKMSNMIITNGEVYCIDLRLVELYRRVENMLSTPEKKIIEESSAEYIDDHIRESICLMGYNESYTHSIIKSAEVYESALKATKCTCRICYHKITLKKPFNGRDTLVNDYSDTLIEHKSFEIKQLFFNKTKTEEYLCLAFRSSTIINEINNLILQLRLGIRIEVEHLKCSHFSRYTVISQNEVIGFGTIVNNINYININYMSIRRNYDSSSKKHTEHIDINIEHKSHHIKDARDLELLLPKEIPYDLVFIKDIYKKNDNVYNYTLRLFCEDKKKLLTYASKYYKNS